MPSSLVNRYAVYVSLVDRGKVREPVARNPNLVLAEEGCFSAFERHEELEVLILALLSRQHVLLVGTKGAAKSMMIRMLASAIEGAKCFERLMTRFTLPDELFGPVSISALKKDRFSRLTRGYLPEANFAFLDEIWKANSSILNSLLALINERLFYNDGEILQCPLETLMGASAELPQEEALSALYDRFLLRYQVKYIAEDVQVALKNLQGLEEERERTMAAVEFLSKLRTAKAELQAFRDRMHRRKAETSQIDFLLGETDRYEAQVKRDYLENG